MEPKHQLEMIWANEGGFSFLFEAAHNGGVKITIRDGDTAVASATLSGWRWARIVKNFEPIKTQS